ncbi:MAG: MauE/DoxX family redox-associated membrane protein [Planctomycetota bacterium]
MSRPGVPMSVLALALRLALGGLFVFAGGLKVLNPQSFSESVRAFKILPDDASHLILSVTFTLPWVEVLAGLAVLLGFWTRAAAATLAAASLVFVGGLISVVLRGLNTPCACFGEMELFCSGVIGWCHVIRTAGFAAVGLLVLATGGGRWSLDWLLSRVRLAKG